MEKNKGFSLVELIIIIAILVIIIGIAVPFFYKYFENSKKSADVASAKAIQEEVSMEYYSNPAFYNAANAVAALNTTGTTNIIAYCDSGSETWTVYGNDSVLSDFMNSSCEARPIRYRKPIDPRYEATPEEERDNTYKYALGSWNNFTPKVWAIAVVDDKPVVFVTDGGTITQGVSPLVCPEYPAASSN